MPAVGDPAPTFTLADQGGESVSLSDLAGRKVLVSPLFRPGTYAAGTGVGAE